MIIFSLLGKSAEDSCTLGDINLKPNFKIMMMGSLEEAIQDACSKPTGSEDVINDLDIEDEEIAIENAHVIIFFNSTFKTNTCEYIQTLDIRK